MNRDPFSSRYDSADSIGAACGCSSMVGAVKPPSKVGGLSINLDAKAAAANADKLLGEAANARVEAEAKLDLAMATGKGVEKAIKDFDTTGKDVGQVIQDIAANPIIHATLASIALAVPVGTVVAAIGEAALALAAGFVELGKALEDTWNDIFMSTEQKFARDWDMTVEEAHRVLANRERMKEVKASYAKNAAAAEEQLAALKVAAGKGDKKARAALVMVEELMQSDTALLVAVLRFGCIGEIWADDRQAKGTGLSPLQLCDVAKHLIDQQKRAGKMSQKDFDFYYELGRGGKYQLHNVELDKPWISPEGWSLKQTPQIIEVKTKKVLYSGNDAIKHWQLQLGYDIDYKSRRLILPAKLKADYLEIFKGSLYDNWQKLDSKATKKADAAAIKEIEAKAAAEKAKAAKDKAYKENKEENARQLALTIARLKAKRKAEGIPGAAGDVSRGVLIQSFHPPKLKAGTFRITGSEEPDRKRSVAEGDGFKVLITPNGRLVRTWWLDVT